MARITSQLAESKIGNRYDMVLIAAARARELRRGKRTLLENADTKSATILSLKEIEQELIGREYLKKLRPWDKSKSRPTKTKTS